MTFHGSYWCGYQGLVSEGCDFVGSCVLEFVVCRYQFETKTLQNIPVETLPFAISQATIPV